MEKNSTQKKIRIYDEKIEEQLDKIKKSGYYTSYNEIIEQGLKLGLPILIKKIFNFKEFAKEEFEENNQEERIKDLMRTQDEMFISIQILKCLISTIYNIQVSQIENINVSKEMIDSGVMGNLPEFLAKIENDMLKSLRKK